METVGRQTIRSQGSSKKDAKARLYQDESVFKAFAMNAKAWKVDGIQPERDKNDGPVWWCLPLQSYIFGFGYRRNTNSPLLMHLQERMINRPIRWRSYSLHDAEVTDAFEINHYWKYHYEFIEDDQLMVELHIFFFSFGQVQEFFVGSQRQMETVGRQTIRLQGSSKNDAMARFCQDQSAFEAFAINAKAWRLMAFSRTLIKMMDRYDCVYLSELSFSVGLMHHPTFIGNWKPSFFPMSAKRGRNSSKPEWTNAVTSLPLWFHVIKWPPQLIV
jgi:hypothetical protein